MTFEESQECAKEVELYELATNGVLYYVGHINRKRAKGPSAGEEPLEYRMVVPTTLTEDVMASAHTELQGGHQGVFRTYMRLKKSYFWPNMFADVERYIAERLDCCTGKGKPALRGHSPGNMLATRPFQIVSMDFVIPLPKSHRKNVALMLFQCAFSGYIMCKPMANTEAHEVAKAFFECVFQRFGACEILRHDRDPRFMGQVFTEFNRMLGQKQRATLSYRPQANGQQERSVQTVSRAIKAYVTDPEQRDWDTLAESLMFALNTAYDRIRQETPFYLVHGWDARSTLQAMVPPLQGQRRYGSAVEWRRETLRRHEQAMKKAWELQKNWKQKRADDHNESGRSTEVTFKEGDSVWLYINQVKTGYTKKLAHLWHGPFRVASRVNEFSVKLALPDLVNYRFHPVVHVSRLELRKEFPERPQTELVDATLARFDFDEELLPEDSWVREDLNEYEVETLLDVRARRVNRQGRYEREYLVKWLGYDETTWVNERDLSCGALIKKFEDAERRQNRLDMMQISDEK